MYLLPIKSYFNNKKKLYFQLRDNNMRLISFFNSNNLLKELEKENLTSYYNIIVNLINNNNLDNKLYKLSINNG
jgi:hypothetical protein